ncbi:MAG: ATP synthase F1 subunit epsilon, partial [Anaerolineales bacterium]
MPIRCEIVSQDRIVYQGPADIVVLPGADGMMGILPNHSPVLATLQFGVITVRHRGKEQYFTVAGGVVEVQPDQVTVLADAAENVEEINLQRAEEAKRRAEEMMSKTPPTDAD